LVIFIRDVVCINLHIGLNIPDVYLDRVALSILNHKDDGVRKASSSYLGDLSDLVIFMDDEINLELVAPRSFVSTVYLVKHDPLIIPHENVFVVHGEIDEFLVFVNKHAFCVMFLSIALSENVFCAHSDANVHLVVYDILVVGLIWLVDEIGVQIDHLHKFKLENAHRQDIKMIGSLFIRKQEI